MITHLLRYMPVFRGKSRIARLLLGSSINKKKDVILEAANNLKFKIPNFVEPIGFELLINGVYERETSDFIIKNLPSQGVFVDIGANIGGIAIPVCKQRNDVRVLCVEASPRVFSYLKFNVSLNKLNNCAIENSAIAEVDKKKVSFFSPQELFGKGSMSSVFTSEAEEVETITLDTLLTIHQIPNVSLIKIDVEGYEYDVFLGAMKTLIKPDAPDIIFEFVDWAEKQAHGLEPGSAQRVLMDYGYSIFNFSNGKPTGKPLKEAILEGGQLLFATKRKDLLKSSIN